MAETEVISGEDISLEYLPGKELEKIVKDQNAFLWIRALFQKGSAEAKVDVQYDEAALDALISGLQCMKPENQTPSVSAKPTFDGKYIRDYKRGRGHTVGSGNLPPEDQGEDQWIPA